MNTQVVGTGTVTLDSGDDTTLKGATVSGKKIEVKVKGDLTIESVPDTAEQDANRASVNISGTLALKPPGIDGMVGKGHGEYVAVGQQSGLFAGVDGFDIEVKGNTGLVGGLIASTADQSKNSLTTGTLTFEDLDVGSHYKVQSIGGGISPDGKPTMTPLLTDKGSDSGSVLSAIAPGTITITDPTHQTQDIGDLNRDTSNTNPTIDTLPDIQKLLQDQAHTLEQYKQAAEFLATTVGDIATEQLEQAYDDLRKAQASGDQAAIAEAKARIAMWDEGGAARAALHAATGGLLGGINGLSGTIAGAVGGAVSTIISKTIDDAVKTALKDQGIDPSSPMGQYLRNLIAGTIVTGLTTAVSGTNGGGYGSNNFAYNYLNSAQYAEVLDLLSKAQACELQMRGDGGCSSTTLMQIEFKLFELSKRSIENNEQLLLACDSSATSQECSQRIEDLLTFNKNVLPDGRIQDIDLARFVTNEYILELVYTKVKNNEITAEQATEEAVEWLERNKETKKQLVGSALDVIPIVGDAKGAYECASEGSLSSCVGAAIGLIPFLGDGAKVVIKKGGKYFEVVVKKTLKTCSFRGDMEVATSNGYLAIERLRPGMSVLSRDETTGQLAFKRIEAQYSNPYKETVYVTIITRGGHKQEIVSNKIHPYFVVPVAGRMSSVVASETRPYKGEIKGGQWLDAADLKAGDKLLDSSGQWQKVAGVRITSEPLKAYNLTVADFHTYFIKAANGNNGIWVHNVCEIFGPPITNKGKVVADASATTHEAYVASEIADSGQHVVVRGTQAGGPDLIVDGVYWELKKVDGESPLTLSSSLRNAKDNFSNEDAAKLGLQRTDTRAIFDTRGNSYWDSMDRVKAEIARKERLGDLGKVKELKVLTSEGVYTWRPK